jgi:hypothetical protein
VIKTFIDDTATAWQSFAGTALAPTGTAKANIVVAVDKVVPQAFVDDLIFKAV